MKIQINNLVKTYAGEPVLSELNMEIVKGSKSAVVGENGSGKSTLLKILSGIENYQEGTVIIPKDMNIGYLMQVYPDFEDTSRNFILSVFEKHNHYTKRLRELENLMSQPDGEAYMNQYAKALERFEQEGGYSLENSLESYAKGLGVYEILDQPFNTLSGGQKTRIALVQLLLQDYEVFCLDEPTNHLDTQGIEWLESHLQASNKTLVIVSHDRQFLLNTVSVFYEVEDGQIVTYHGDYDSYRKQRHERYLQLVKDFEQQQKEIKKLQLAIRRYRQWGNDSDNEDFYKRAKAIEKRLERIEQLPKPTELRNQLNFDLSLSKKGSKDVVIAKDLVIGYDKPLLDPLNFIVQRKQRFAIVAPNGIGKTTLLKTLLKEIEPISGIIKVGESVDIGYLPQVINFDNKKERILEHMMRVCGLGEERMRSNLARFGFYKGDMYKFVSNLSGGEQVRLKLLEIMLKGNNCIILDEPTNHLDIQSCEIIEEVLSKYEGTIIVISHDRMFLRKLDTCVYNLIEG